MRSALLAHIHGQTCLHLVNISRSKIPCRVVRSFMSVQEASAPSTQQPCLGILPALPVEGEQLTHAALRVLTTPNATDKASLTHQTASMWRDSRFQCSVRTHNTPAVPARPARDDAVSLISTLVATRHWPSLMTWAMQNRPTSHRCNW